MTTLLWALAFIAAYITLAIMICRMFAIGSHADEFDQRARDARCPRCYGDVRGECIRVGFCTASFIVPPVETLHNLKDRK